LDRGGGVLLIEDEESVRWVTAAMLRDLGFEVLEAPGGVEALEVLRQHQSEIRCVVCDLTMPRMSGWETLAALRELSPDLPVILASGYGEDEVMAGSHRELPQAFLAKPFDSEHLAAAIGHALAGKKRRP
jgi:CheY-like chemotaxis protein